MTLNLSDTLASSGTGPEFTTKGFNPEIPASLEGPSFGQLLSDMQWPNELAGQITDAASLAAVGANGQSLADPLALVQAPLSLTATADWPLKQFSLGPNLNAITPETAAPDTQSLEAFARAQGLDDKAVSWLFGKPDAITGAATATATATGAVTATASASLAGAALSTLPHLANTLTNPQTTITLSAETLAANPSAPAKGQGGALAAAALALLAMADGGSADKKAAASPAPGSADDGMPVNLLRMPPPATAAALALLAMAEGGSADKKAAASPAPGSADDGMPVNLLRMPPPAIVWMQRNLMNSVAQDNAAAQKGLDISESELDLGADWDPDTLSTLLGKEPGNTAATGSSATGTHTSAYANFAARWDAQATARADLTQAGGPASAEQSSAAARSENIQNLAEKMGQAVGQRILSEMEKGQWHLKLQLRPATLGHIEVEMRMRSGEFDAVFTAPNAITRDLLQDGMAKLKETLAQMGMDVASVYVGNGQTGQSGGDSTPRSAHNSASSAGANAKETASESDTRVPLVKTPKEGLDVLV